MSDKELRIRVQAKYDQIVKDHGELFERTSAPMSDSDRAEIRKTQRVVVFVLGPVFVLLLCTMLVFVWDDSLLGYLFLGFIALIIIAVIVIHFSYERAHNNETKEILKGVLTNKQRIDDGDNVDYDFEISNKETISVSRATFKKFALGDLVEIEILARNSVGLSAKVKRTGSILDHN